jgi:hypothetical protein
MDVVELIATYYSIDDLLSTNGVNPEVIVRYLIDEDLIDLEEYLEYYDTEED